ncbi:MAG TPA: DUF4340 domain-containing protein [Chryseolinea sp.]
MRRSNNKILLIVFIVLVAGFVITRVFRAPSRERNIDETLMAIDTAKVSAIHISPVVEKGTEIRLLRTGKQWQIQRGGRKADPEMAQIRKALGSLVSLGADRVLTRKKESWANYHVDSTATHVSVTLDANDTKEFWVGKLDGGGSSVRLKDDNNVYAVDASFEGTFNRKFTEWRNKTFVTVQPEKISKITFQYPGDSSFVLTRSENKWAAGDAAADSSKVQTYLNRFRSLSLRDFADDFTRPNEPALTVTLHDEQKKTITVQGWKVAEDRWVLNSSQHNDVYFSSDEASLIREVFAGKKWFMGK